MSAAVGSSSGPREPVAKEAIKQAPPRPRQETKEAAPEKKEPPKEVAKKDDGRLSVEA